MDAHPRASRPTRADPARLPDRKDYVVLSCRYCSRPVSIAHDIDEMERAALRHHLRGCAPERSLDRDVVEHFRVAAAL